MSKAIRGLSIKQPWASLIATGVKTIETRTWTTIYRGDILICASKTTHQGWEDIITITGMVKTEALGMMPYGQAICIAELWDVKPMTIQDSIGACCEYYEEAYSWHLRNIRNITAFPVKGSLGLFEVKKSILDFRIKKLEELQKDYNPEWVKIDKELFEKYEY